MSRYSFVIGLLLIFYTGCSAKSIKVDDIETTVKSTKVTKASADFYYLAALDCEYRKEYLCSSLMFEKLYDITKQKQFLKESARFALLLTRYDIYDRHIKVLESMAKDDEEVASFLIPYYIKKHNYKSAEKITKGLLKDKKSKENYQLLAALYMDTKEYKKAEEVLNRYKKEFGCDPKICGMLLLIKTKNRDIKGSESLLKSLYKETNNQAFEIELLKLYVATRDFKELENYVESSKSLSKEVLIDIYSSVKEYKRAEQVALELYKEKKDPYFLAESAIFLYEGEYKKNKTVLMQVIDRFEKSVDKVKSATFYNYYGYLLIDHDVDIKKGIEYVKKALKLEPKSDYYLDSLAWGYYKLGKCQEAYSILDSLKDKEQEEIKEHILKAKECLKK